MSAELWLAGALFVGFLVGMFVLARELDKHIDKDDK